MKVWQQSVSFSLLLVSGFIGSISISESAHAARVTCATENKSCKFSGARKIRYGTTSKYVERDFMSSPVLCANSVFGDPARGQGKSCSYESTQFVQAPAPAPAPVPAPSNPSSPTLVSGGLPSAARWIASENANFSLSAPNTVYFGEAARYTSRILSAGSHSCSNGTFGDPSPGRGKACYAIPSSSTPPPVPPTPPVVTAPSIQFFNASSPSITAGQSVTLSWGTTGATSLDLSFFGSVTGRTSQVVSPTVDTNYVLTARNSAGAVTANRAVAVTAGTPTQPPGTGPYIDVSLIPRGSSGSGARLISNTGTMPYQDAGGIGAFRTVCTFSHMNFDDAIVYPNQPGRAHLHTYFGNTAANGNSTPASIANSGNSTCRGGIVNRSAYWVPSLIDTRNGRPLAPEYADIYYKTGYGGVRDADIRPFPPGFRMIAGAASASSAQYNLEYICGSLRGRSIPTGCAPGTLLEMHVQFPQCWNGRDLDSPDHRSHIVFPNGGCPSSHPVAMPEITMISHYMVPSTGSGTLRLSSDTYSSSLPGGFSGHADWMHGWEQEVMDTFVSRVINLGLSGGSHIIGDGRTITGER